MSNKFNRHEPRRSFMLYAAGASVVVGAAMATWPLIQQGNPHPGSPRAPTLRIGLRAISQGTSKQFALASHPILVRHRTAAEIAIARAVAAQSLRDPLARNANLPQSAEATDLNRSVLGDARWLVLVATCTHLPCVLRDFAETEPATPFVCPCCASRFDTAGRVVSGPAQQNLAVPKVKLEGQEVVVEFN